MTITRRPNLAALSRKLTVKVHKIELTHAMTEIVRRTTVAAAAAGDDAVAMMLYGQPSVYSPYWRAVAARRTGE